MASAHTQALPRPTLRRRPSFSVRRWTEREGVFSWLMVIPPALFLAALVGYPFVYGIWLSLQDRPVARAGEFVGLANFITNFHDPVFWRVAQNTFVYTFAATALKMAGGLALALVMNQEFKFKNLIRAMMLLPFIVPTVLSTIAWMWILDPSFSVINWFLVHWDIAKPGPSWLGNPNWAMFSLIMVNTWRGLPFYAITLLAGLQTISPELYEAATIDGASTLARFRYVTVPLLKPVIFIVTMFSVIFTFSDFQLVYVLTRGGPANATHLFATYAFDVAMSGGQFGLGASIALSMLPPLALLIAGMAWYMRSEKT
jgi:multiple sugar transport system permease protein